MKNELVSNLDKLHTTNLGAERIKRNIGLETENIVDWCRKQIESPKAKIARSGKNWHVNVGEIEMTVNANSYTIITAHKYNKRKENSKKKKFKIITMCGSLRFSDKMVEEQYRLGGEGNLVIGCNYRPPNISKTEETVDRRELFGEIHRAKINLSDAIFVVNVGGYIGPSTKNEIEYAKKIGKEIIYMEEPNATTNN